MKLPVSAVLIAQNEAERLATALKSVAFCDEILVVDGGSSDATSEVAKAHGAKLLLRPFDGFVAQKKFAVQSATHDLVLSLDADEEVTAALRSDIESLAEAGSLPKPGYRVPRVTHYLGREIRATDWYPDWQLRFFDRRRGGFQGGLVHESVRIDGEVGSLAGEIIHRPYRDVNDHKRRIDRYTTLWAEEARARGQSSSIATAYGAAAFAFLRNYVFKGGLFLGSIGFTISRLNASYVYAKYAKLARGRQ